MNELKFLGEVNLVLVEFLCFYLVQLFDKSIFNLGSNQLQESFIIFAI